MTNHIEQMMKTAGVGFISQCKHGDEFPQNCDCDYSCEECSAQIKKYPDFTPAKQLELIKLIAKANEAACFYYAKKKRNHSLLCLTNSTGFVESIKFSSQNFETALAGLVLRMLKKNELDKAEVKRILEE